MSWTLAAVGEEFAFRGYLQTRVLEVLPGSRLGVITAVLLTSLLFGLIHTEQGVIGIALTTIDAIFFSVLRYRFHTLWASILAHGFNNTIGMVAFYIAGPFLRSLVMTVADVSEIGRQSSRKKGVVTRRNNVPTSDDPALGIESSGTPYWRD